MMHLLLLSLLVPMSAAAGCDRGGECVDESSVHFPDAVDSGSTIEEETTTPIIETRIAPAGPPSLLPKVEPCPESKIYCGEDNKLYPEETIKKLIENTILDSSTDMNKRFFTPPPISVNNSEMDIAGQACQSRIEFIPRYGRAKNVKGKWKYLVQRGENELQQMQITVCQNSGSTCINDPDCPSGPMRTICKQVYKTQKLLAVDEKGEMVVDTFELPSACNCFYVEDVPVGLRAGFFDQPIDLSGCEETNEVNIMVNKTPQIKIQSLSGKAAAPLAHKSHRWPHRFPTISAAATACPNETTLCDDSSDYPGGGHVQQVVSMHKVFNDSVVFNGIFGGNSDSCGGGGDEGDGVRGQFDIVLKTAFDLREESLCKARQEYIFPKKAQSVENKWRFIVNTNEYKQGVTVEICDNRALGRSCKYGGQVGNYPTATMCKQLYSLNQMFAITEDGNDIYVETFKIPSACVCKVIDMKPFQ